MINILILTTDFNYCCGRSNHIYSLIKYYKRNNFNVHFIGNRGDAFERLHKAGIIYLQKKYFFSKPLIFKNLFFLKNYVKNNKIDIIHSHHRVPAIMVWLVKKIYRINVINLQTEHSILKKKYFLNYHSDKIIAVNDVVKENLKIKFGLNDNLIVKIPNFIDIEEYNINNKNKANDKFTILAAGRLVKEKNFELLIRAVSFLIEKNNVKLIIVGEGKEYKRLKELAEKLEINFELPGVTKDISTFLNIADLCVLPSKKESLSTFMLEAGLFKKVFIGSDIKGINDIIENRENGLLFKVNSSEDLKQKIDYVLKNRKQCVIYGHNLYKIVIENYNLDTIGLEIIELCKKLINDPKNQ